MKRLFILLLQSGLWVQKNQCTGNSKTHTDFP